MRAALAEHVAGDAGPADADALVTHAASVVPRVTNAFRGRTLRGLKVSRRDAGTELGLGGGQWDAPGVAEMPASWRDGLAHWYGELVVQGRSTAASQSFDERAGDAANDVIPQLVACVASSDDAIAAQGTHMCARGRLRSHRDVAACDVLLASLDSGADDSAVWKRKKRIVRHGIVEVVRCRLGVPGATVTRVTHVRCRSCRGCRRARLAWGRA
jgi:hypothetical protein